MVLKEGLQPQSTWELSGWLTIKHRLVCGAEREPTFFQGLKNWPRATCAFQGHQGLQKVFALTLALLTPEHVDMLNVFEQK